MTWVPGCRVPLDSSGKPQPPRVNNLTELSQNMSDLIASRINLCQFAWLLVSQTFSQILARIFCLRSGTSSPSNPSVHISLKLPTVPLQIWKIHRRLSSTKRSDTKTQLLSESHTSEQNYESHQVYAKYSSILDTNATTHRLCMCGLSDNQRDLIYQQFHTELDKHPNIVSCFRLIKTSSMWKYFSIRL